MSVDIEHAWRNGDVTGRPTRGASGAETGVEFQLAPAVAVTPFVGWDRAARFSCKVLRGGVRATYRVSRAWSVTATVQYFDVKRMADRMEYSLGFNRHF